MTLNPTQRQLADLENLAPDTGPVVMINLLRSACRLITARVQSADFRRADTQ